jgi:hypothetical protein
MRSWKPARPHLKKTQNKIEKENKNVKSAVLN